MMFELTDTSLFPDMEKLLEIKRSQIFRIAGTESFPLRSAKVSNSFLRLVYKLRKIFSLSY